MAHAVEVARLGQGAEHPQVLLDQGGDSLFRVVDEPQVHPLHLVDRADDIVEGQRPHQRGGSLRVALGLPHLDAGADGEAPRKFFPAGGEGLLLGGKGADVIAAVGKIPRREEFKVVGDGDLRKAGSQRRLAERLRLAAGIGGKAGVGVVVCADHGFPPFQAQPR